MSFIDSLMAGLSLVASVEAFLALFVGIVIGVIGGAIPGLSATMAVALTLPFTFSMQPITGILLLLGVYKGGIFGGCIPAILIKTPGTPASSATILDGHPMAERGEAGRALGMALWASCTADLVSNLALILFAGWLASFALNFGPPEFFALILFSLTIIAGVSGYSLLRGALSALLGLMLDRGAGSGVWDQPVHLWRSEHDGGLEFHCRSDRAVRNPRDHCHGVEPHRTLGQGPRAWQCEGHDQGLHRQLPVDYSGQSDWGVFGFYPRDWRGAFCVLELF